MLGKHTLEPGEKTFLDMTFDTKGRSGPFRKTATISVNNPGQADLEVTMEGTVEEAPAAKIRVDPRRIALGDLQAGSSRSVTFTVTNTGVLPLVIDSVHPEGAGLRLDGKGCPVTVVPHGTHEFQCSLETEKTEGTHEGTIVIESNAKNAPEGGYQVRVEYKIAPSK